MSPRRARQPLAPLLLIVLSCTLLPTAPAEGQSLLSRLRWVRTQTLANEFFTRHGLRPPYRDLEPLGVKSDSIRSWMRSLAGLEPSADEDDGPSFVITSVRPIGPGDRADFERLFTSTDWAFLGSTSLVEIDTMRTRDIRARLEHRFGPPTITLAERPPVAREDTTESVQFEYWFILNESMPAYLLDVNGPWDRGVVFAAPSTYRSILADVKESLLWQLISTNDRKAFADYYFNVQQEIWYVTAFDGASFRDVRIDRPDPRAGRPVPEEYGIRAEELQQ